jgi:hypothetical protein
MVETNFLVIGAGPAGASLACFLASYGELLRAAALQDLYLSSAMITRRFVTITSLTYNRLTTFCHIPGLKGIMVSTAPGTADTPRAHITNMAALGKAIFPFLLVSFRLGQ